jgi:drug/metabolite transporter (DMT)-like permease
MTSVANSPSMTNSLPAAVPLRAWLLGLLGVLAFALSVPMTRLAGGSVEAPALPPLFVAVGRAVIAGVLGSLYLAAVRAPWPSRAQWRLLAPMALGVVFGWPVLLGYAVRHVDAAHASVLSGVLPLATAAMAAALLGQRAPRAFWAWALVGLALVIGFAAIQGAGALVAADGLLLLAVAAAAYGYVQGSRLSTQMAPEHVISWAVVLCLPATVPLTWFNAPTSAAPWQAWAALGYVGVVSMWLGFFAWYRALALGGALRVSQVQVVQPFLSGLLAVPLLGEPLAPVTLLFLVAVVVTVWLGQRARTITKGKP